MKRKIIFLAAVTSAALLILLIFHLYNLKTRNAVDELIGQKRMINILVAGSNKDNNNRHSFFAIFSMNTENGKIGATFIPPSFRVRLDDSGKRVARIDEVPVHNFNRIRYSLKQDLKINIPFYAEFYGNNVRRLVDFIEGVDLFILDQVRESEQYTFGLNYMDGDKIMRYINDVEANSIYLKYDRIQDILLTLYYNRNSYKKYRNIDSITRMVRSVETNLLPQEILSLGKVIFRDEGEMIATMLPGGIRDGYYVTDDITYKIYEKEFLTSLIADQDAEKSLNIKVLNGTNVSGLARRMRNRLIREGLNVVEFGTSPYPEMKKSMIISRKGNYTSLKKVSELTGIRNINFIIDNTLLYNILIIIGEDQVQ